MLVVGGGDGGVLREAVRHPGVECVTLCEIDEVLKGACTGRARHEGAGRGHVLISGPTRPRFACPRQMVVKASKQFLPTLARGFDHPKVTVVIGDGFEYLRTHTDAFDVIITDSSDPVGMCMRMPRPRRRRRPRPLTAIDARVLPLLRPCRVAVSARVL